MPLLLLDTVAVSVTVVPGAAGLGEAVSVIELAAGPGGFPPDGLDPPLHPASSAPSATRRRE
jgi:hypothetical protein